MRKYARLMTIGVVLAIACLPGWTVQAAPLMQGSVTLSNPGFEEGTTNGWIFWNKPEEIVTSNKETDLNSSWFVPMFVPNREGIRVHGGGQALEINNEYRKWRGGVYQTVSAAPGTKVVFKVWAQGYTGSKQGMLARVGINPDGSASVDAASWSGTASVGESYVQIASPEVTVGGSGKVTVFTWAESPAPLAKTAIFFDDAYLEITGQAQAQPTSPAQPPAQPTSPPVVVQPVQRAQPQADGSIVYTVKSGDTLSLIAMAHDTTVDSIMQLNGLSSTIISVGQSLVIRGPTVAPTATLPPAPPAAPTLTPSPVAPTGKICIQAFNDRDGDGNPGGVGEDPLPGVVFALSNAQGTLANYTTDGVNEPYCFADLTPDTFAIKITPPNGYDATTPEVWNLAVSAGQLVELKFGAKRGGALPTSTPSAQQPPTGGDNSFFAIVGRVVIGGLAVLVLIGLGAAGMYFVAMRR